MLEDCAEKERKTVFSRARSSCSRIVVDLVGAYRLFAFCVLHFSSDLIGILASFYRRGHEDSLFGNLRAAGEMARSAST